MTVVINITSWFVAYIVGLYIGFITCRDQFLKGDGMGTGFHTPFPNAKLSRKGAPKRIAFTSVVVTFIMFICLMPIIYGGMLLILFLGTFDFLSSLSNDAFKLYFGDDYLAAWAYGVLGYVGFLTAALILYRDATTYLLREIVSREGYKPEDQFNIKKAFENECSRQNEFFRNVQ